MAIYVSDSGKEFTPAPEGTHQAVCVDVIDKGEMETPWGQKRKIDIRWQISELMENGKPFIVQKRYTASLNEKAVLRHDLQAWRGKPFTFDELAQFDIETVIGANCLVNVIHRKGSKGGTFANVASVAPLVRGMSKMEAKDYVRDRERRPDSDDGDTRHYEEDDLSSVPF